jgi:hypothetical protein
MSNFHIYLEKAQEYIWKKKPKQWLTVDLHSLDKEVLDKLWEMYQKTYVHQNIDNYKSIHQLTGKYKLLWLIDVDKDKWPDAFIIYKEMPNDNKKISLMGSDGSEIAKRVLKDKMYELLGIKGWYIEGSKKIDDILFHKNFPFIDDEDAVKKLISGEKAASIKWIGKIPGKEERGGGYYERDLTNTNIRIIKRIYGRPNV